MAVWNPWRGCKKCSPGCLHCYIHKGDARRGVDTGDIHPTKDLLKPGERKKDGAYKMGPGLVYTCFTSDFLLEEADPWREDCWRLMRQRQDCTFLFLTKRIARLPGLLPADWGAGYENVVVCCTVEDRQTADARLPVLAALPLRHKCITAQPLLEEIDVERYLPGVELLVVGGESDREARPLNYDWVLSLRAQCVRQGAAFQFRQCGTHFIKDGRAYTLPVRQLCAQARKAGIDYRPPGLELNY